MYRLVKKILWSLDPEKSHRATIRLLSLAQNRAVNCCGLLNRIGGRPPLLPTQVMGLTFPSPLGLAAGFDKNGEAVDALQAMGFGFIELGRWLRYPQEIPLTARFMPPCSRLPLRSQPSIWWTIPEHPSPTRTWPLAGATSFLAIPFVRMSASPPSW